MNLHSFKSTAALNEALRALGREYVERMSRKELDDLRHRMAQLAHVDAMNERDARATEQALSRHKDKP